MGKRRRKDYGVSGCVWGKEEEKTVGGQFLYSISYLLAFLFFFPSTVYSSAFTVSFPAVITLHNDPGMEPNIKKTQKKKKDREKEAKKIPSVDWYSVLPPPACSTVSVACPKLGPYLAGPHSPQSMDGLLTLLPPLPPPGCWDEGRATVFGFFLLASFPLLSLRTSLRFPLLCLLHFSTVQPHVVLLPLVL
ncbi:hypothetical protein NDU88_003668 [Pleurodeles waltl]|uniref:Uncharacterized protein n=1 Tax=Pleurodeles waltl TaxID=8319 RepID=A0AAV7PBV1_PLEWA|nr:hypothetical protein NDU88_003668 [Pleurodeles waltl]